MAMRRPLKVVLTNYPEGKLNGQRPLTIGRSRREHVRYRFPRLYISNRTILWKRRPRNSSDWRGREVRLRYAYFIRCEQVIKDAEGNIVGYAATALPPRRQCPGRPQGQSHSALGGRRTCIGRRGAAMSTCLQRGPRPDRREGRILAAISTRLPAGVDRLQGRTVAQNHPPAGSLAIRTSRLFLYRLGQPRWTSRIQPHCYA